MEDAGPLRISYRQVGKLTGGRVVRGAPPAIKSFMTGQSEAPVAFPSMKPRPKRSHPSIPSKFETTLHVGQRERDAFGGRTVRFQPPDNELPGPGNYHKMSSFVKDPETCPSVSKLGYGGGFVSKTKRFSDTAELNAAAMPAPGSYTTPDFIRSKAAHDYNRAKTSANFARPRKFRDSKMIDFRPAPGPGEYEQRSFTAPTTKRKYTRSTDMSSTFKSASKRDSYLSRDNGVPAPGAYDTPEAPSVPGGTILKSIPDRLKALYPAAHMGVPGPGSYKSRAPGLEVRVKEPDRASSFFSNTQHDRYGRPYVRKVTTGDTPGPGAYTADVTAEAPRLTAASATFLSASDRGADPFRKAVRPPGPAFYKPEPVGRKSFLLNAAQRWV